MGACGRTFFLALLLMGRLRNLDALFPSLGGLV